MIRQFLEILSQWSSLDTSIVITGMLASMACALPGCFLLLRRQSMMGDALSHTSLLGIAVAYVTAHQLHVVGWLDTAGQSLVQNGFMFGGAIAIGVLAAVMTETIHQWGRVEASAALGVVFTVLFAAGLLLIRLFADDVDLDPGCVLYGSLVGSYKIGGLPDAAYTNAAMLILNAVVILLLFKELKVSAFDSQLATSIGIPAKLLHYVLMALTAATVVAAFETVGVILVIAMLIGPAATAYLLTNRLWKMVLFAELAAALSAVLGHVLAITLPPILFDRIGIEGIEDASTAGMMAVVCGLIFMSAVFASPRYGLLNKLAQRFRLSLKIISEDLLGLLYRLEERHVSGGGRFAMELVHQSLGASRLNIWMAMRFLVWKERVEWSGDGLRLTDQGRSLAKRLVRSHRLWESYLQKHFSLPEDHLHHSAMRVEHFIGDDVRDALSEELGKPAIDPHGKQIPDEPLKEIRRRGSATDSESTEDRGDRL